MKPTSEQEAAIELFRKGNSMIVEAGAGTGKTSTLVMMGNDSDERGQYIAFNKGIVTEAQGRMPGHVAASTAHSLAYRGIGYRYSHRLRSGGRVRSYELAELLGVDPIAVQYQGKGKVLSREFLASHVMRAVQLFCQSADQTPGERHFPYVDGIDEPDEKGNRTYANNVLIRGALSPFLHRAWLDLMQEDGRLPFKHDHYLKAWHLSGPKIKADFILFDEAQDANPVIEAIVGAQDHAQIVYVGDSQQAIYGWRGAVNALSRIDTEHRIFLTRSFRFGQAIADAANLVLDKLNADLRLQGHPEIQSRLEAIHHATAILCRTNAMAVGNLLRLQGVGKRVHLVGGADEVAKFVRAADRLQHGQPAGYVELACFSTWAEVQDYVASDPQGDELKMMVDLIDLYGTDSILRALARMPGESEADVVVSTAHKAKGREWPTVKLAGDFNGNDTTSDAELRLAYVAVTRAKEVLDDGGLLSFLRPPQAVPA